MNKNSSVIDYAGLPRWVQQKIIELDVSDPENWITQKIPALGERSVLETINSPGGEQALRNYFAKVIGRF